MIEIIKAVAGLWPLALIVFLTVCVVLFRRQIEKVLERFTNLRWRRGDTELSLSQEPGDIEARPELQAQAEEPPMPDQTELESSEEVLDVEPKTSEEWIVKMIYAFSDHDIDRLEKAYEQAQNAETNAIDKLRIEGFYLRLRYERGDNTAFDKLHDLAERVKDTPDVLPTIYNHIGWAYELGDDFLQANEAYETAVEAAQTEEARANYAVSAARCLFSAGKREEAFSRIADEIGKSSAHKALSTLYEGLASLYERADDSELRAIALEKAIEYNPNNTNLRFGAAYSYSDSDLEALALMHYQTLLKFEPDHTAALNNVGIVYGRLKMPIKQTNSYSRAFEMGNTLAAANLAYGLMDAGFADKAMEILYKAQGKDDVHPNVGSGLAAVTYRKEAESRTETETLAASREQRQFILAFAKAYFESPSASPQFEGSWHFPDGVEATIARDNNKLEVKWTRGDKEHLIVARARNCGAQITKYSLRGEYLPTSLGSKGYAYLSQDNRQMNIMVLDGNKRSFLTLRRKSNNG